MRRVLLLASCLLCCLAATAQTPADGSVWGVLAVRAGGDTILNVNSGTRLVPASSLKMITTGAALSALGPHYRYESDLAFSGEIVDSTLVGDLYIIGGGDPTLVTDAAGASALFARWRAFLDDAGIRGVQGSVIGDSRYFDGYPEHFSWEYEDLGFYYGKGPEGLNFYKNAQDITAIAGAMPGDPVLLEPTFPLTPWMTYGEEGRTGEARSGDKLYYFATDLAPEAAMRGTLGIDLVSKVEHVANHFPAYTCAHYFCQYLRESGIPVSDGPADVDPQGRIRTTPGEPGVEAASEELVTLGSTFSEELPGIIRECLVESDNFYADALLRTVGRELGESASYAASLAAEAEQLRRLGLDPAAIAKVDGSGLSRHNYVSPGFFVRFLKAMMLTDVYDTWLHCFAQPGAGTLSARLQGAPQSLRSRCYLKTGSMSGVQSLGGYILPESGRPEDTIIFCIIVNNATASAAQLRRTVDSLVLQIAR